MGNKLIKCTWHVLHPAINGARRFRCCPFVNKLTHVLFRVNKLACVGVPSFALIIGFCASCWQTCQCTYSSSLFVFHLDKLGNMYVLIIAFCVACWQTCQCTYPSSLFLFHVDKLVIMYLLIMAFRVPCLTNFLLLVFPYLITSLFVVVGIVFACYQYLIHRCLLLLFLPFIRRPLTQAAAARRRREAAAEVAATATAAAEAAAVVVVVAVVVAAAAAEKTGAQAVPRKSRNRGSSFFLYNAIMSRWYGWRDGWWVGGLVD